jgi:hypothetical protein
MEQACLVEVAHHRHAEPAEVALNLNEDYTEPQIAWREATAHARPTRLGR